MAKSGIYDLSKSINYCGKRTKANFKSEWELTFMIWCDRSGKVKSWSYEEKVIRYEFPIGSNKFKNYYVDFYVELHNNTKWLIEIKPSKFESINQFELEKNQRFKLEYLKNFSKWMYAKKYAINNNIKFCILTEKQLDQFKFNRS